MTIFSCLPPFGRIFKTSVSRLVKATRNFSISSIGSLYLVKFLRIFRTISCLRATWDLLIFPWATPSLWNNHSNKISCLEKLTGALSHIFTLRHRPWRLFFTTKLIISMSSSKVYLPSKISAGFQWGHQIEFSCHKSELALRKQTYFLLRARSSRASASFTYLLLSWFGPWIKDL